jgi:outer membrane immunogenic protein
LSKAVLLTATLAICACNASQATATDIFPAGSMLDPPDATAMDGWTGFSLGAGLGGAAINTEATAAGTFDADTTTPATIDSFSISDDEGKAALFGTLQLGYDRRLYPGFVVGLFADYDLSGENETDFAASTPLPLSGAPGDRLAVSGTAEFEDIWTIGGRLGFLANPTLLVYGLIGWTHADLSVSGTYSTNIGLGAPIAFSEEDGMDAVTVGLGVERLLSPGLSLKFEYRYTDLGELSAGSSLATLAGGTSDGAAAVDLETEIHSIRAVLTWRLAQ